MLEGQKYAGRHYYEDYNTKQLPGDGTRVSCRGGGINPPTELREHSSLQPGDGRSDKLDGEKDNDYEEAQDRQMVFDLGLWPFGYKDNLESC
jgi:hypothetical protein